MSDSATALAQQSNALRKEGREQEALVAASQALKLDPSRADMWGSIGFMMLQRGRWKEATQYLHQAVTLAPQDASIRSHYAIALAECDDYLGAYKEAKTALQLQPESADANYMMGEILCRCGHYDRAISFYDKARASGQLQRAATFGQGFATFMTGDLDAGMDLLATSDSAIDKMPLPDWDGKPDPKLHLVLCGEYGFGDILQFIRYVRLLQKHVGKITLSLPYPLVDLIRTSYPEFSIHAYHVPPGTKLPPNVSEALPPDAKARCFYMNLPYLLGPFDALASEVPYLLADPERVSVWKEKLKDIPRPRIGLVWSGNPLNQNNHNRSVPFAELQPLIELARPHLVSLQRDGSKEAQNAGIFDATPFIENFADSAAAMANLDLVITVCSAPAHLAGGMGMPAWTMLAFAPDWRWLIGREDSIWYPHMRLFRVPQPKAWKQAVEKLCTNLEKFLSGSENTLVSSHLSAAPRHHPDALILPD